MKPPVTSLRLKEGKGNDRLSVWVDHALSGTLVLPKGQSRDVILFFARDEPAIHTHAGGEERGCVVTFDDFYLHASRGWAGGIVLVSERGELTTVGEVRAKDGEGRVA